MKPRKPRLTPDRAVLYTIKVEGRINPAWIRSFPGVTVLFDGEMTTLNSILADQSALRGFLCYLWDLNLILLSVQIMQSEDTLRSQE